MERGHKYRFFEIEAPKTAIDPPHNTTPFPRYSLLNKLISAIYAVSLCLCQGETFVLPDFRGILGKHFVLFEADGTDHEGYAGNLLQRNVERRVLLVV